MSALALSRPYPECRCLISRCTDWRIGEPSSPAQSPVDIRLRDGGGIAKTMPDNREIFARGFEQLIRTLVAGGAFWIVDPLPEPSCGSPKPFM